VTFPEAIQTVLRKYADFEGVAKRPEFWWWFLFTVLVSAALSVFNVVPIGETASVGRILVGLWSIATLLPTLAVLVRRLRDAGCDWKNVFWLLVPIAGLIVLAIYLSKPSRYYESAPAAE
jgi:uncharacterized membrane protein YhaH (DUF805 family)